MSPRATDTSTASTIRAASETPGVTTAAGEESADDALVRAALTDSGRVGRAFSVPITETGDGRFVAQGSHSRYFIRLTPWRLCGCLDLGAILCKHLIAAMMRADDPRVRHLSARHAHEQLSGERAYKRRSMRKRVRTTIATSEAPDPTPPAATLADAIAQIREARRPVGLDVWSWILTHPEARTAEWRLLAREFPEFVVQAKLLAIPPAATDPDVRLAIAKRPGHISFVGHLLPRAEGPEYRALFQALLQFGAFEDAVLVLEHPTTALKRALQPADVVPLYHATDRALRARAIAALSRVRFAEPTADPAEATASLVIDPPSPPRHLRKRWW